jgi:hypothetical protein
LVIVGIGFGWWVRFGCGWGLFPDVGVFPAVVERNHDRVWGLIAGDEIDEWFDDRRWLAVVGVAQPAPPDDPGVMTHIRAVDTLAREA